MGTAKPAHKERPTHAPQQQHPTWIKHHTKRNAIVTALVVTALVVIIVVASLPHPTVKVGQQAPDFTLTDVNGNGVFHLDGMRGRPVFLEFMRTQCEYCQAQAPILSQAFGNYSSRVVFVSITIDPTVDQPSILQNFAQSNRMMVSHGQPWYWLRDDMANPVQNQYGINGLTPTMFMVDGSGTVQSRLQGLTQMPELNNAFQRIV